MSRSNRTEDANRFEQFKDALPLIARIYAEILAEVAQQPGHYRAWLDGTTWIAFTKIIQNLQQWERALESLSTFLAGGAAANDTAKPERKAKRLVWFLDRGSQDVTVAEQSAKGQDGWTDGRPVAMKRLHELDPRLDYLTPHDRAALRTLRRESGGWYGEDSFTFDVKRTIPALIGHPAVFHAGRRAQRLDLVSYPVELLVTQARGG